MKPLAVSLALMFLALGSRCLADEVETSGRVKACFARDKMVLFKLDKMPKGFEYFHCEQDQSAAIQVLLFAAKEKLPVNVYWDKLLFENTARARSVGILFSVD